MTEAKESYHDGGSMVYAKILTTGIDSFNPDKELTDKFNKFIEKEMEGLEDDIITVTIVSSQIEATSIYDGYSHGTKFFMTVFYKKVKL